MKFDFQNSATGRTLQSHYLSYFSSFLFTSNDLVSSTGIIGSNLFVVGELKGGNLFKGVAIFLALRSFVLKLSSSRMSFVFFT